ncbi:nonribosomal peptide synthetase MxaA [Methyloligella solikamskensis]|uniref:Nonribosomal peptide synthetase MxaA n=1 Tax=Methyloligella solikamskensis TaxID=1177756 RepID=A0ABW3JC90_9HYPH
MRRLCGLALALGILAIACIGPADPGRAQEEVGISGVVHAIRASQPRDFGYFPGDIITREIYVAVDKGYHLQDASVPPEGPLNYWLDLRTVKVKTEESGAERRYLITLTYQTFYVPLEVKRRDLPGFTLQFAAEKGAGETADDEVGDEQAGDEQAMATAHIPSWSFLMSPLREIQTQEPPEGPVGFLKPDRAPKPLNVERLALFFALSGFAVALFAVLLAHHYAWGPFRSRPSRPFTVAARQINAQKRGGADADHYRASLLALHRAFDTTAGHRVFAEDVPAFLDKHPAFGKYASEIERFYEASRQAFFKGDTQAASAVMPLVDIASLAGKLGAMERRS